MHLQIQEVFGSLSSYQCCSSYGEGHDSGCLQPFLVPTIYHIVYTYPQIHPEKGPSLAIHSRSLALGWTKSYDFVKHYYNQLHLHRRFLWRTKTNCSDSFISMIIIMQEIILILKALIIFKPGILTDQPDQKVIRLFRQSFLFCCCARFIVDYFLQANRPCCSLTLELLTGTKMQS